MRVSTTVFLSFLLAGLSIYYFASGRSSSDAGVNLEPIKILTLASGDGITLMEIESQAEKEKISLRKDAANWVLEYPISDLAENFLVEGMVSALTFSQRVRRIPVEKEEWKEFGLDQPDIKISLETSKEHQRRTLLLGQESPVKVGVYARWEDEKEYFLVAPEFKASFQRTVYSLRRKKLFRVAWDAINQIYLKLDDKEFKIQKEGDWRRANRAVPDDQAAVRRSSDWRWIQPRLRDNIPIETATDLIYAFQSLYVKEFLDGKNPDRKEFKLQDSDSVIWIRGEEGPGEKLILGAEARGKDARYVLRDGEKTVLLVSDKNLRALFQTFETTYHKLKNGNRRKSSGDSEKDRSGLPEGEEKSG